MICPSCHHEKLDTRRTFDQGDSVKRERGCSKCGAKLITLEMQEDKLEKERRNFSQQLREVCEENKRLEMQMEKIKNTARAFFSMMNE